MIVAYGSILGRGLILFGPYRQSEQGAVIGPGQGGVEQGQQLGLGPFVAFHLGQDGRADQDLAPRVLRALELGLGRPLAGLDQLGVVSEFGSQSTVSPCLGFSQTKV